MTILLTQYNILTVTFFSTNHLLQILGSQADILRIEIIYREGGIYLGKKLLKSSRRIA